MKNHHWMILALIMGGLSGWMAGLSATTPESQENLAWVIQNLTQPVGQIFLRLIFMIVVPLVVSALILGIYELSATEGVRRVIVRTVTWTLVFSSLGALIGVGLVNLFQPGRAVSLERDSLLGDGAMIETIEKNAAQAKPLAQNLVELIPKNPIDAASRALEGEMLSLMVFSLLFGLAMGLVARREGKEGALKPFFEHTLEVSMVIVRWALKLAPLAIFCLVFSSVARLGPEIFRALFAYVGVVVAGLLIQLLLVYGAALKFVAGRSPLRFFRDIEEVLLTAFSTASSNATLPYALEFAEERLRLSPKISRFILTVGATANQNGTALFEGVTVLFLAQLYGVDLNFAQQIQVIFMSILAGIGTAGVPGGSLPLIVILLQSVGVPAEGIGIVLGVDRLLDMCRTAVNVGGDLVIATVADEK